MFSLNTANFKYLQFNQAITSLCSHSSIASAVYIRILQMSQLLQKRKNEFSLMNTWAFFTNGNLECGMPLQFFVLTTFSVFSNISRHVQGACFGVLQKEQLLKGTKT